MTKSTNEIEERLDQLNELRESVRTETIEEMGTDTALRIQEVHLQNWIDLANWFTDEFDESEQDDILFGVFLQLFNKLQWMQFLLLRGNYGAVFWHIREALEGIVLALSVSHRGRSLSPDARMEMAMEIEDEEHAREWIELALRHVLDLDDEKIEMWNQGWWTQINKHVHASPQRMEATAKQGGAGTLIADVFDPVLANETLDAVDVVFDIIWAIWINEFPELAPLAEESEHFPTDEKEAPFLSYVISKAR